MAARRDKDLFMSVRLDDGGRICNVLVSSQTTGQDVVESLKPDDDKLYYLVEIWKGCERQIDNGEKLKSVLLQWGSDLDDVTFMLKRKCTSSRQSHSQKKTESPRSSPVQFKDNHMLEQQLKVESMQKELQEKEKYLKALRTKGLKNGLKSEYVHRLELRVMEQEEQLKSMRSLEEELFKYQVDNEKLNMELKRLRSLFVLKHQQLSEATARVEALTQQLADRSQGVPFEEILEGKEKTRGVKNGYQRQLYVIGPSDRPLDSLRRRPAGQHENPRATDKHVLRHNKRSMDVIGPSSSARNSDVFLGHVLGLESDELNRLQSWRDEEENDTETSADSGHVSIDYDSPPYQNGGVGPSFQFNGNHTKKYFEKVERFDIDQEFGFGMKGTDGNLGELNVSQKAVKDKRVSAVNGALPYHPNNSIPRTNNRSVGHAVPRGNSKGVLIGPQNYSNPLCIQTGEERSVVAPAQFLRTQSRHDSPQSISSNSSESSQLSTPNSDAETRSSSPRPRNRARPNSPSSRALVRGLPPTNNHPNDSTAFNGKETRTKTELRETRTDRTMGSISLYQRNKGDCNSLTPEGRLDTRVTDPVIKKSQNESKSDEKPTTEFHRLSMPSVGVQELLSEIPALKLTTRDEKPVQILTRAEKDSENECGVLPVEKSKRTIYVPSPTQDPKQTVNGKLPQVSRTAPKPVPRKRAKTPPARTGAEGGNLVVTSTKAINEPRTISSDDSIDVNEDFLQQERGPGLISKDQMFESGMKLKDEVANAAGESTLRNETIRGSKKSGKRVSLDPHAVLLHASLEGELDLVKTIIHQVEDPSFPNSEGLTALHHAVCSGHDEIVKFLIQYGCDINAADMQGWTALHCAAANNSLEMSKFLVTHGACIFAVTSIEGKTPSQCCEKDSEGFEECFSYLSDLENNFGVSNQGIVYSLYAYQACRKDELSFQCGECLTVVRRGDVTEKEWWWARNSRDQLGYIPRNLLGLHPRVAPDV